MSRFECEGCGNEPLDRIPVMRIIDKVNSFFARNDYDGAGRLLEYWEKEARALGDESGLVSVLSELVGYYRKVGNEKLGLKAIEEATTLLEKDGLTDKLSGATIYVNCATALKSFGRAEESLELFYKALSVYESDPEIDDYLLASLYNNMAFTLEDVGEFDKSEDFFNRAIDCLKDNADYQGEVAITYINLAELRYVIDETDPDTIRFIEKAISALRDPRNARDGDFAYILEKCVPSLEYFGYASDAEEFTRIYKDIYESNR